MAKLDNYTIATQSEHVMDRIRENIIDLEQSSKRQAQSLSEEIINNPGKSLLVAIAGGLVIALFSKALK